MPINLNIKNAELEYVEKPGERRLILTDTKHRTVGKTVLTHQGLGYLGMKIYDYFSRLFGCGRKIIDIQYGSDKDKKKFIIHVDRKSLALWIKNTPCTNNMFNNKTLTELARMDEQVIKQAVLNVLDIQNKPREKETEMKVREHNKRI